MQTIPVNLAPRSAHLLRAVTEDRFEELSNENDFYKTKAAETTVSLRRLKAQKSELQQQLSQVELAWQSVSQELAAVQEEVLYWRSVAATGAMEPVTSRPAAVPQPTATTNDGAAVATTSRCIGTSDFVELLRGEKTSATQTTLLDVDEVLCEITTLRQELLASQKQHRSLDAQLARADHAHQAELTDAQGKAQAMAAQMEAQLSGKWESVLADHRRSHEESLQQHIARHQAELSRVRETSASREQHLQQHVEQLEDDLSMARRHLEQAAGQHKVEVEELRANDRHRREAMDSMKVQLEKAVELHLTAENAAMSLRSEAAEKEQRTQSEARAAMTAAVQVQQAEGEKLRTQVSDLQHERDLFKKMLDQATNEANRKGSKLQSECTDLRLEVTKLLEQKRVAERDLKLVEAKAALREKEQREHFEAQSRRHRAELEQLRTARAPPQTQPGGPPGPEHQTSLPRQQHLSLSSSPAPPLTSSTGTTGPQPVPLVLPSQSQLQSMSVMERNKAVWDMQSRLFHATAEMEELQQEGDTLRDREDRVRSRQTPHHQQSFPAQPHTQQATSPSRELNSLMHFLDSQRH